MSVVNECRKTRNGCLHMWRAIVAHDWGHCCAKCGKSFVSPHRIMHIIDPGNNKLLKYKPENGIPLCARCDMKPCSPTNDVDAFLEWLDEHHPEKAWWIEQNRHIRRVRVSWEIRRQDLLVDMARIRRERGIVHAATEPST